MFKVTHRPLWLFQLAVGSTFVLCSCDRMLEWSAAVGPGKNLGDELSRLHRANRAIITKGNGDTVKNLSDSPAISAIVTLFQQHPTHWLAISGVFPDYQLVLFDGETQIGSLGISAGSPEGPSKSTINVGDYYQRIPAEDVTHLAKTLGVPWPSAH